MTKPTYPVFHSDELGYFTCTFELGNGYEPGDEKKYADDTGYKLMVVCNSEETALTEMFRYSDAVGDKTK